MATQYRKADDTEEPIPYTIERGDSAVDLTDASGVAVYAEAPDNTLALNGVAATIVTAAEGEVEYKPAAGELVQDGTHNVEWEVTWTDGDTERFPKKGYQHVVVDPTL